MPLEKYRNQHYVEKETQHYLNIPIYPYFDLSKFSTNNPTKIT